MSRKGFMFENICMSILPDKQAGEQHLFSFLKDTRSYCLNIPEVAFKCLKNGLTLLNLFYLKISKKDKLQGCIFIKKDVKLHTEKVFVPNIK